MKKRLLACLLTAAMLVSLFPLSALAAEVEPYTGGLCHHHQEHSYEDCGYIEAVEGRPCGYVCHICPVQAMIDALPAPKDITAENRAGVEAQLEAIGEAWAALAGLAGNELPAPLAGEVSNIEYWDWDESQKKLIKKDRQTANVVTKADAGTSWSNSWYVVNSNVEISDRVTVTGDVHLILEDGCTLDAMRGIDVSKGSSLTIYGQTEDTGALYATSSGSDAGIGGGGSDNYGGDTTSSCGGAGGKITINGGTITARSESGAGIGGGYEGGGGTINISGGTVTVTSNYSGAGNGGEITISGGTVTATSRGYGDGHQPWLRRGHRRRYRRYRRRDHHQRRHCDGNRRQGRGHRRQQRYVCRRRQRLYCGIVHQ